MSESSLQARHLIVTLFICSGADIQHNPLYAFSGGPVYSFTAVAGTSCIRAAHFTKFNSCTTPLRPQSLYKADFFQCRCYNINDKCVVLFNYLTNKRSELKSLSVQVYTKIGSSVTYVLGSASSLKMPY